MGTRKSTPGVLHCDHCGCDVKLTEKAARSFVGSLNAKRRKYHRGGRPRGRSASAASSITEARNV